MTPAQQRNFSFEIDPKREVFAVDPLVQSNRQLTRGLHAYAIADYEAAKLYFSDVITLQNGSTSSIMHFKVLMFLADCFENTGDRKRAGALYKQCLHYGKESDIPPHDFKDAYEKYLQFFNRSSKDSIDRCFVTLGSANQGPDQGLLQKFAAVANDLEQAGRISKAAGFPVDRKLIERLHLAKHIMATEEANQAILVTGVTNLKPEQKKALENAEKIWHQILIQDPHSPLAILAKFNLGLVNKKLGLRSYAQYLDQAFDEYKPANRKQLEMFGERLHLKKFHHFKYLEVNQVLAQIYAAALKDPDLVKYAAKALGLRTVPLA